MNEAVATVGTRDTLLAVALLIVCALGVGLMPPFARYGFADGMNTPTFIVIRAIATLAILLGCIAATGKAFRVPREILGVSVLSGVSAAALNIAHLEAVRTIDIGLAILILFAHPFVVALYYHMRGTSKLTLARVVWSIAAFLGLGLALAVGFSSLDRYGLAMAFLSAILATVLVISMVKVSERVGGFTTNLHLALWTIAIFAATLAATDDVRLPRSVVGWASAFGFGTLHVVTFVSFLVACRLIGASRASMFSFAEPLAAILFAAWLFDEFLTPTQWLGVALVAAGLFFMEAKLPARRVSLAKAGRHGGAASEV